MRKNLVASKFNGVIFFIEKRSHKKQIENKRKRDTGNKNRIKFIITSKNFSKTF